MTRWENSDLGYWNDAQLVNNNRNPISANLWSLIHYEGFEFNRRGLYRSQVVLNAEVVNARVHFCISSRHGFSRTQPPFRCGTRRYSPSKQLLQLNLEKESKQDRRLPASLRKVEARYQCRPKSSSVIRSRLRIIVARVTAHFVESRRRFKTLFLGNSKGLKSIKKVIKNAVPLFGATCQHLDFDRLFDWIGTCLLCIHRGNLQGI